MVTIFLSLGCAFIWGFNEFFYKKISDKHKMDSILVYSYLFEIVAYFFFVLVFDIEAFNRFNFQIYLFLIPILLISSFIGNILYVYCLKNGKLSIVSPILATDPIYTVLMGLILFQESVSIYALMAVFFICLSICALNFLSTKFQNKARKLPILAAAFYAFLVSLTTMFEKSVYLSGYKITDFYFHYIFLLLILLIFFLIKMHLKNEKLEKLNKEIIVTNLLGRSASFIYSYLLATSYVVVVAPLTGLYSVVTHILATHVLKEKLTIIQKVFIYLIVIATIFLLVI